MRRRAAAAWRAWRRPHVTTAAAAIAYQTLFSIAPLLVLAIVALGRIVGRVPARAAVRDLAEGMLGVPPTGPLDDAVTALIDGLARPGARLSATVAALALVLLGASGVFGEVRRALNLMWGGATPPGRLPWRADLAARAAGLALVLGGGTTLGLSLVTAHWIGQAAARVGLPAGWLPDAGPMVRAALGGVTVVLFTLIYRRFGDRHPPWRSCFSGGVIAAVLFGAGKRAFAAYIALAGTGSIYGAAGTLVVFVLWIYVSASVMLFGAAWAGADAGDGD